MFSSKDKLFMKRAIELAKECFDEGEVPVGAVIVQNDTIIGEGKNKVIFENDVTSHAEINAIRDASKKIKNYRLNDCSMYVTLEPCHMCAKAAVDARMSSIIFAASEPKTGSIISIDNFFDKKELNHNPTYQHGLLKDESSKLLKDFFRLRR
ncbi:MAG: tRNA-specific adenosine deaminase [Gammaproteobacteria bacterium]|nr:tRNA-specific adenosine deaminase [Gammaproteobacteria bacterium]